MFRSYLTFGLASIAKIFRQALPEVETYDEKPALSESSKTNFFYRILLQNSFLNKIFRIPMGICISFIIPSICIEHIEHTAITFYIPLTFLLSYVVDTFCIFRKDYINDFQAHRNSIRLHIKFIIEKEQNQSLLFLSVLVKHNRGN